jgi:hypothetical protein
MMRVTRKSMATAAALAGATLLAACGDKAPPPPPPPPPKPIVVVIPPKPMPPNGASPNLAVPPADATGLRQSVNRNITPAQTVWNLRSAYNVAALNCHAPQHADILINYRTFLKSHAKTLTSYNRKVDEEFRGRYGSKYIAPREKYMTEVYNHFALPPTMTEFCTAVLAVSRDAVPIKSKELEAFAARSLPNIEVVFDDFYRRYGQYRVELAAWEAQYGTRVAPYAPVASAASAYQPSGGSK